jgi:hypothetical protein
MLLFLAGSGLLRLKQIMYKNYTCNATIWFSHEDIQRIMYNTLLEIKNYVAKLFQQPLHFHKSEDCEVKVCYRWVNTVISSPIHT